MIGNFHRSVVWRIAYRNAMPGPSGDVNIVEADRGTDVNPASRHFRNNFIGQIGPADNSVGLGPDVVRDFLHALGKIGGHAGAQGFGFNLKVIVPTQRWPKYQDTHEWVLRFSMSGL